VITRAKTAKKKKQQPKTPKADFSQFHQDHREQQRLAEMTQFESEVRLQGYDKIAGIDEAGRGPLAGPVVAAACLFTDHLFISGINDSKKIPSTKRRRLFEILTTHPHIVYSISVIDAAEIDSLNIYQATVKAMESAVSSLQVKAHYLLVDGMELKAVSTPNLKIIKGDQRSLSIASASIIAKETRDEIMCEYDRLYPEYGFKQHKGYGTAAHLEAIKRYGPCPIHRRSFEPIKSKFLNDLKFNS